MNQPPNSIDNNLFIPGDGKVPEIPLGHISIPITDEKYIEREIKETNEKIQERENEIFILEKKLLTLNGIKRQMDKKSGLHISNTSTT